MMIGSRKITPPRMLRIVPFGERSTYSFEPELFNAGFVWSVIVAHLTPTPNSLIAFAGVDSDLVVRSHRGDCTAEVEVLSDRYQDTEGSTVSRMNDQMIRVISSPSSSTTGFSTLIFAIGGDAIYLESPSRRSPGPSPVGGECHNLLPRWPPGNAMPSATTRSPTSRRPLEDYNLFEADRPLGRGRAPRGCRVGDRADRRGRRVRRLGGSPGARPAGQRERSQAEDP